MDRPDDTSKPRSGRNRNATDAPRSASLDPDVQLKRLHELRNNNASKHNARSCCRHTACSDVCTKCCCMRSATTQSSTRRRRMSQRISSTTLLKGWTACICAELRLPGLPPR